MNHNLLLITQFWNDQHVIPFFLKHYAPHCRNMIFVDYHSKDKSRIYIKEYKNAEIVNMRFPDLADDFTLLNIKNAYRKEFKRAYDWFLVCDTDEFLYYPKGITELITEMESQNCNIISPTGFQMVADDFPEIGTDLITERPYGVTNERENHYWGKSILFNNKIDIEFNAGCHTFSISKNAKFFTHPQLKMLHYKFLDIENVIKRKNLTSERLSDENRRQGWGVHNTEDDNQWRNSFYEMKSKAVRVV